MTNSQIFKAAHKLAKSVHVAGDCYRVTFGAALKIVIAESKAPKSAKQFFLDLGGKEWVKEGFDRVYINAKQFNACLATVATFQTVATNSFLIAKQIA